MHARMLTGERSTSKKYKPLALPRIFLDFFPISKALHRNLRALVDAQDFIKRIDRSDGGSCPKSTHSSIIIILTSKLSGL